MFSTFAKTIYVLLVSFGIALSFPLINFKPNNLFVAYAILLLTTIFLLIYILMTKKLFMRNIVLSLVGMLTFSFWMVPLYNVFCDVTGLNGKVDLSVAAATPAGVDMERTITVEFDVNYNQGMPWDFKPQHTTLTLHPGEIARTAYYALNPTKGTMRAQAIPSISPSQASKYFKKIECFCFNSQQLGPKESANLGLQFYLDPKIPKDIKRLTLSYTLFDITDNQTLKGYNPHK